MAQRRPVPFNPARALEEALVLLEERGNPGAAAALCRQVLAQDRRFLGGWIVLAASLLAQGEAQAALEAAESGLALDATAAPLLFVCGTALNQLGRAEAAAVALNRATARAPLHAGAWLNLGIALTSLDRFEPGEVAIRNALRIEPALAAGWASLGAVLMQQLRTDEAIAAYGTAVRLRPDFAPFRWDEGFARLLAGDMPAAWEAMRSRKPEEEAVLRATLVQGAEWTGLEVAGQRLLVCSTQGLGDAIQFARYIPLLTRCGARVVVCCQPVLHRLLARLEGVDAVIAPGDRLPRHDGWLAMSSLPGLFGTTLDNIPFADGYLAADAARWQARLGEGRWVGLAWAGNPGHSNDARRSMAAATMARLLAVPEIRFVSLQTGREAIEGVLDVAAELTDLAETAGLVAALDLVVSVDTAMAHLAGALGRPSWVALPAAHDWRWLQGRDDSPWYASARLFRQRRAGDWDGVVGALREELRRGGSASAARSNDDV